MFGSCAAKQSGWLEEVCFSTQLGDVYEAVAYVGRLPCRP
jgi:hypothetical protein